MSSGSSDQDFVPFRGTAYRLCATGFVRVQDTAAATVHVINDSDGIAAHQFEFEAVCVLNKIQCIKDAAAALIERLPRHVHVDAVNDDIDELILYATIVYTEIEHRVRNTNDGSTEMLAEFRSQTDTLANRLAELKQGVETVLPPGETDVIGSADDTNGSASGDSRAVKRRRVP